MHLPFESHTETFLIKIKIKNIPFFLSFSSRFPPSLSHTHTHTQKQKPPSFDTYLPIQLHIQAFNPSYSYSPSPSSLDTTTTNKKAPQPHSFSLSGWNQEGEGGSKCILTILFPPFPPPREKGLKKKKTCLPRLYSDVGKGVGGGSLTV